MVGGNKMNFNNIVAGTYRLNQDVVNPRPDKRTNHWTGQPKWVVDSVFVIIEDWNGNISIVAAGERPYAGISAIEESKQKDNKSRYKALIPFLERISDTVASLYTQHRAMSLWPHAVTQKLVDMGLIEIDDVRKALIELAEE